MALIDRSDNPIKGFRILTYHQSGRNELYLRCRGKECPFFKRLPVVIDLEAIISLAHEHRSECDHIIQRAPTHDKLPIAILPKLPDNFITSGQGDNSEIICVHEDPVDCDWQKIFPQAETLVSLLDAALTHNQAKHQLPHA